MNRLRRLQDHGQSVWYDNIHRAMISNGDLERMIRDDGLRGITSNPTIFEKAIASGKDYDRAIASLVTHNPEISSRELFFSLAVEDIQAAADKLAPVYRDTDGKDGYVSLEVSPDLAYDTDGTIEEAKRLWQRVDRPNLMIKVPATAEGVPAVEALISEGINVNVTLLFSVERYRAVADAYLLGLEARMRRGLAIDKVASVASFFISRVDSALDKKLAEAAAAGHPQAEPLLGKMAIANAKAAYRACGEIFGTGRFAELARAGARVQRLLWASTGAKNPAYSDVLYVDQLIGPETVNTLPPATYGAFLDHGDPQDTLAKGVDQAIAQLSELKRFGIALERVTAQLEREGVEAFATSFRNLLATIEQKADAIAEQRRAAG